MLQGGFIRSHLCTRAEPVPRFHQGPQVLQEAQASLRLFLCPPFLSRGGSGGSCGQGTAALGILVRLLSAGSPSVPGGCWAAQGPPHPLPPWAAPQGSREQLGFAVGLGLCPYCQALPQSRTFGICNPERLPEPPAGQGLGGSRELRWLQEPLARGHTASFGSLRPSRSFKNCLASGKISV